MKISSKVRNSFVSLVIIISISAIVISFIIRNSTDTLGGGLGIFFYILLLLCIGGLLGVSLLLIDFFKLKHLSNNFIFNFIATLNTLMGITGFMISFLWRFEKAIYLAPFTICLLIGLLMFHRIEKLN